MRELLKVLLLTLLCLGAAHAEPAPTPTLTTLVYHDVAARGVAADAGDTVNVDTLARQLDWLQRAGYTFVSAQQVIEHRAGGRPLPDKAVLLTFDDGYRSFYTQVYPLLQTLNVPAVLAVVGSWVPANERDEVLVDGVATPGTRFVTREQLRELSASGLVELASHTYNLHRSIVANALGSRIPAVIARAYDARTGRNETPAAYEQRLVEDLRRNATFVQDITGVAPRIVVWPYGRYNGTALRAARDTGHVLTMSLDETSGTATASLALPRKYIQSDLNLKSFAAYMVRKPDDVRPMRHVTLNLDSLLNGDGTGGSTQALIERRLSRLLDELSRSSVSAVLVNPFGSDCRAFFADQRGAAHPDLLSRVAWQLRTRVHVEVLLDMDVAGCLQVERANDELIAVLATASFDGLVMRTDGASAELTEQLARVYASEEPNRLLAGTTPFAGRALALQVVSDCRLPTDENLQRMAAQGLWLSIVQDGCDSADAVARLRRAGLRHWGLEAPRQRATLAVPAALMRQVAN